MRVIVAGGTGFVGSALVKGLLDDGHELTIIERPNSKRQVPKADKIQVAVIDPEQPISDPGLIGDAIINLVAVIREFPSKGVTFHGANFMVTKNLADHAKSLGIRRFLQMSALGVTSNPSTKYFSTKLAAENYLKESGLAWTIFRPAFIFGPGDQSINMFANMVRRLPIVPVVGDGRYRLQPVYVDDVVAGFRSALTQDNAIGKTFEFGGPEIFAFNQLLDMLGQILGKSAVHKIHQPLWLMRCLADVFGSLAWFPVSNDQITMLLEENFTRDKSYWDFVGITPKGLRETLIQYLR